jgi:hypothetical protein
VRPHPKQISRVPLSPPTTNEWGATTPLPQSRARLSPQNPGLKSETWATRLPLPFPYTRRFCKLSTTVPPVTAALYAPDTTAPPGAYTFSKNAFTVDPTTFGCT